MAEELKETIQNLSVKVENMEEKFEILFNLGKELFHFFLIDFVP